MPRRRLSTPRPALLLVAGLLAGPVALACSSRPAPEERPAPARPAQADSSSPAPAPSEAEERADPLSYARPEEVVVRELDLALDVLFAEERIAGVATYRIERRSPTAPLHLDTRGLEIEAVEAAVKPAAGVAESWAPTTFTLGAVDPLLGAALTVNLPESADRVRVRYRTSSDGASGLHWLTPAQTSGDSPFLYSQSQAIHARSWVPSQDSPAIRTPVRATVTVDRPLRPVMAANDDGVSADGERPLYRFSIDEPIPAYLLAIAVGELEKRELGPRTAVWAEPAVLPRAAAELAEIESMLPAIEDDFGRYRWGRYEVLILPPSFPFGGMENPIVTFATPTILAGDRSLISLIAHELAHSWSGNLVTNATWDDLWLNEGPTTYLERRIIEELYGRERAEMEATLGKALLRESLAELPEEQQLLRSGVRGQDPDAVFSDIAYEKGALFLRTLEETYGRETFDPFLRAWFDEHAFTGQNTAAFVDFVRARLLDVATPLPGKKAPDLTHWIYGPGLPTDAPEPSAAGFAAVEADAEAWLAGRLHSRALGKTWGPLHWLHFLGQLPPDLAAARLAELDHHHQLTASDNRELLAIWLEVAVRRRYRGVDERLRWFLTTIGRRKFLTPLYLAILAADGDSERARSIYEAARSTYHPIARESLDPLLLPQEALRADAAGPAAGPAK